MYSASWRSAVLMNEEINAWEAYDGLKEALANDPVPPELAEELDRRYEKANEASQEVKYQLVWCPLCRGEQENSGCLSNLLTRQN